jgi:hypothetical protein
MISARSWEVRTLPTSTQVDGLLNQIHHGRKASGTPFRTIVNSTSNAAIVRTIDALHASGIVTTGPASRVVVLSGKGAEVTVTDEVPDADGYVTTRQMLTISLSTEMLEDDFIRLDTEVTAATARARTTVALQNLGIPIGTSEAKADGVVLGAHDALLMWVPQRDHGVLVELKAEPME